MPNVGGAATRKRKGATGKKSAGGKKRSANGGKKAQSQAGIQISQWKVSESDAVPRAIERYSEQCLKAYRANPSLVLEHANMDRAAAEGGYGRRQLFELIQNGADE